MILESVRLPNDFETAAWDPLVLGHVVALNKGAAGATGNAVIVSAGTGLGHAVLYWDGERHHPFVTEGGHADFAPRNELEYGLIRYLQAEYGHVDYEHVCSDAGLINIYHYLHDADGRRGRELDAAAITRAALSGEDHKCTWALDLMISIYGAQAGNAALASMATGGVYLGGSIPTRILSRLEQGGFMRAFLDKGRFRSTLERIPVSVILNDETAAPGAARAAAEGL